MFDLGRQAVIIYRLVARQPCAMPYLARSACLIGYVAFAHSVGLDPFLLLKGAGLDRDCLSNPERKISVDKVRRLLNLSTSAAGIDDFGLRLAEARPLSFMGPLSLAVRDAATLREALDTASRYLPLHREGVVLSLEKMGNAAIYKMVVLGGQSANPRQSVEAGVGVWHRIIRQLLGSAWRPRPVWFSHSAPGDMTNYLRIFGPWVEFGHDCTGILLETRDLDAPLPTGDLIMAQHVRQYLEPMLAQINATMSEKARQLVYDLLPSGRCSVEQLAARLDMNPRTLHRHLAREGETCWSIVDGVRGDLARRYVEDKGRSLGEISDLLGFSNLSSFSRWFRDKFASSPMIWRAGNGGRLGPPFSASS